MSVQRGVNALLGTRRLQAVAVPPGSSCRAAPRWPRQGASCSARHPALPPDKPPCQLPREGAASELIVSAGGV